MSRNDSKESEFYKMVIENTTDYIALTDIQGRYIYVSPSHRKMGYAPKNLLGKKAVSLLHPEDRKKLTRNIVYFTKELAKSKLGSLISMKKRAPEMISEFRVCDSSGRWHYIETVPYIIKNPFGQGYATLLISRDIDERKRMELSLKDSEEKYRILSESAEDMIFVINKKHYVEYVNTFGANFLGKPAEKIIGKSIKSLFKKQDFLHQEIALKKVFEKGSPLTIDNSFSILGKKAWLSTRLVPIYDNKNNIKSVLGISRDVTENKKNHEELVETKHMLENITQGISDSVLLISKDYKILWANRAAQEQTGKTKEDIFGAYCYELTHKLKSPCKPPHDICPIGEVIKTGASSTVVHTHFDKEKNPIFVEVTAYPLTDENGKITQFVHVSRDITQRKNLEKKTGIIYETIRKILEKYEIQEIYDTIQINSVAITESEFGFLGIKTPEGYMQIVSMSRPSWEKCKMPLKDMLFKDLNNVFGHVITDGKTILTNRPLKHKLSKGKIPEGHIPITSFLGVPIKNKEKVIGNICVANKKKGYDDSDKNALETFSRSVVSVIVRKKAEDDLKKLNEDLNSKISELDKFNKLSVGREMKMIELKKRIKELEARKNR